MYDRKNDYKNTSNNEAGIVNHRKKSPSIKIEQ